MSPEEIERDYQAIKRAMLAEGDKLIRMLKELPGKRAELVTAQEVLMDRVKNENASFTFDELRNDYLLNQQDDSWKKVGEQLIVCESCEMEWLRLSRLRPKSS